MSRELHTEEVYFASNSDSVSGYLAHPTTGGPFSAVLLIHEVFGLVDHIKDVAERIAREGYLVLAVDLYSRDSVRVKSFAGMEEIMQFLGAFNYAQALEDLENASIYLGDHFEGNGRVSVMGFCMGGGLSMQLSTQRISLQSAVVFYGRVLQPVERVQEIRVPLLAIYGEKDGLMQQVPGLKEQLEVHGKTYELYTYPEADHGFFNDTRESFNAEAAQDAWQKLLAFFKKYA